MEIENGNGSKNNTGECAVADDGNGRNQHDETATTHSESTSRASSSSSSSSSSSPSSSSSSQSPSTPLKGQQVVSSDKIPNSISDELEVSQTDSPPVQVMDRNSPEDEGYDPSRIPASVFERSKSNTPAEWSCTSNESLFSIHLENNSFSTYYGDFMKSGELYKSGELLSYSPAFPLTPPPAKIESNEQTVGSVKEEEKDEKEKEENPKENDEKEDKENSTEQHPAVSWRSPTTSNRSNRSSNSTHSFSFPILAGDTSEMANAEAEEQKKHEETQAEANPNQGPNRWLYCFPPCPWCCSSHSSCSCSCS